MSRYRFDEMSGSDQIVVALPATPFSNQEYQFKKKQYPNIYIPNRPMALHLSFQDEHSEEIESLRKAVEEYNEYLAKLEAIPDFLEFFKQHGLCVSRDAVSKKWSEEIANLVFSKGKYCFFTELRILGDYLFDCSIPLDYQVQIEKNIISIPIGKSSYAYPETINDKKAIWNWMDNGHDFCYFLWELLGEPYRQNEEAEEEDDGVCYHLGSYDLYRDDNVEPQIVNIFHKLESLRYIESYTIKPEQGNPRWVYYGKGNGTVDLALVDTSFLKNKLLMEQIELLLWQKEEDITEGQCFLTDRNGKQYISKRRGALGGHNSLKIYGRLDCPSAARYIAKGQYVRHRIFFEDEETAIAAGYRPCGVCMPEAYKIWKASSKGK